MLLLMQEEFLISTGSNVGIGTRTPGYPLDITYGGTETSKISAGLNISTGTNINSSENISQLRFHTYSGGNSNIIWNMGIGYISPSYGFGISYGSTSSAISGTK